LSHALPEHVGKEADEDVRLDPVFSLVPDRPQAKVLFVDAEGGFLRRSTGSTPSRNLRLSSPGCLCAGATNPTTAETRGPMWHLVQVFIHFADRRGPYREWRFDKRDWLAKFSAK